LPDLAIPIGLQASGKTTFYKQHLSGHIHVSKDLFRSARRKRARQLRLISEADVALTMRRNALRPPGIQVPDVGVYATLKRLRALRLRSQRDAR
jgi:hypothetical protein